MVRGFYGQSLIHQNSYKTAIHFDMGNINLPKNLNNSILNLLNILKPFVLTSLVSCTSPDLVNSQTNLDQSQNTNSAQETKVLYNQSDQKSQELSLTCELNNQEIFDIHDRIMGDRFEANRINNNLVLLNKLILENTDEEEYPQAILDDKVVAEQILARLNSVLESAEALDESSEKQDILFITSLLISRINGLLGNKIEDPGNLEPDVNSEFVQAFFSAEIEDIKKSIGGDRSELNRIQPYLVNQPEREVAGQILDRMAWLRQRVGDIPDNLPNNQKQEILGSINDLVNDVKRAIAQANQTQ